MRSTDISLKAVVITYPNFFFKLNDHFRESQEGLKLIVQIGNKFLVVCESIKKCYLIYISAKGGKIVNLYEMRSITKVETKNF